MVLRHIGNIGFQDHSHVCFFYFAAYDLTCSAPGVECGTTKFWCELGPVQKCKCPKISDTTTAEATTCTAKSKTL